MDFVDNSNTLDDRGVAPQEINACGLRCPMPLLKTKQALNKLPAGALIRVLATDAGASRDIPSFAKLSGHTIVSFKVDDEGVLEFVLRKRD